MAGHEEARLLDLGDHAALAHDDVVEVIRAECDGRARSSSGRHEACSPVSGLASAEEDGLVDDLAEGFLDTRTDLAPDVVVGVVKNCLRDRNDDSDLLSVEDLLVPLLLGGLLLLGVSVHEVRDRKSIKHGELGLLAGHVGQAGSRLSHGALDDLAGVLLRNEGLGASSVDDLGVGVEKLKIKVLSHCVIPP